jgi:hypothetical protein
MFCGRIIPIHQRDFIAMPHCPQHLQQIWAQKGRYSDQHDPCLYNAQLHRNLRREWASVNTKSI